MISLNSTPFDTYHGRYEAWFERHQATYYSELLAVRSLLPWHGLGIEIGVGTGRFAAPLGVRIGIDPSGPMLSHALKRGVLCSQGVTEYLPFKGTLFDYILIVATICFVDDPAVLLAEAHRILKPGTPLVIGFIERNSILGRYYLDHKAESVFYRDANFYSAEEIEGLMRDAGFSRFIWGNTLSRALGQLKEIEPLYEGREDGAFVVVRGFKT